MNEYLQAGIPFKNGTTFQNIESLEGLIVLYLDVAFA
jgi:hypothetical protein